MHFRFSPAFQSLVQCAWAQHSTWAQREAVTNSLLMPKLVLQDLHTTLSSLSAT